MSRKTLGRDLTVGIVVLVAAFIFTIGVFSIGSEQRVWVRKVSYRLEIPEANGLQGGSPVRLAGVQVGTVTGVSFSPDPNNNNIEIQLSVDQAHQHRIREDTRANVKILTLLGGEKYVELSPGSPDRPVLPPGSLIPVPETFSMEQLGELSAGLTDDIKSISANVRIILERVLAQEGVVGRMLLDPNFGSQTFADIAESARIGRRAMEDIDQGRGLVGHLMKDEDFADKSLASIQRSLDRMEKLMDQAMADNSPLHAIIDPNGKAMASLDNIHQASANMKDFSAQMKEGNGLVGRMMSDKAYADEVLGNIRRISADLASITNKINSGDGTLGGLINDPELIEDLRNVVRGVKQSRILSWFIRNSREEGEKYHRKQQEKLRKQPPPPEREPQQPQRPDTGEPGGSQGEK
jgi:phospholipid/cholesterol/gamma-HCH transport system substrate-binding protein